MELQSRVGIRSIWRVDLCVDHYFDSLVIKYNLAGELRGFWQTSSPPVGEDVYFFGSFGIFLSDLALSPSLWGWECLAIAILRKWAG